MPRAQVGMALVVIGIALAVLGALVWSGALAWFGRLPGDFRIDRPSVKLFVPITSMLLVSFALSLVAALVRAITRR